MAGMAVEERDPWLDALQVARLLAVDPHGLGGVQVHAGHGPVRDAWISALHAFLPAKTPVYRLPLSVSDDRLLGGLDLSATLQAGRPVLQRGLLTQAHEGLIVAAMAERMTDHTAARLCAALDAGELVLEREGLRDRSAARIAVIALDESAEGDDPPPARLLERLAFRIDLGALSPVALQSVLDAQPSRTGRGDTISEAPDARAVSEANEALEARRHLARVRVPEVALEALCTTALALGIDSLRAPLMALRAARAAAALDARDEVDADDLTLAARLVLAPRATRVPAAASADDDQAEEADKADSPADSPPQEAQTPQASDLSPEDRQDLDDSEERDQDEQPAALSPEMLDAIVLEAARAAIPEGLLQQLGAERAMAQSRGKGGGRTGAERAGRQRGRPVGSRPGLPRDGARLAVIDTLRAAAPWQRLRQQTMPASSSTPRPRGARVQVRASDFRVMRLQERAQTTTVFAVDASGSSALHRLAEAKGAVELLLAECYVRRDQVAVVAFRGRGAEVLLAPTRSLARARRELSGLPGGGGTPLSQGIETATMVAEGLARKGGTPIVVLLTDGKANVAHDGTGGRAQALTDAREAAQRMRLAGHACMLIDTSPRPSSDAQDLAQRMGAAYIALPHADAAALSRSVQAASRAVTGSAT